ncbi:MAG: hypothetical protein V3T33_05000, partial [Myxococcota bacterium]
MRHPFLPVMSIALAAGAAALIIEMTWMRWFRLLFGATAPAASATLVAFFAGHALGAALCARYLSRVDRPLRLAAVLSWTAAAWAIATPLLLLAGESLAASVYHTLLAAPLRLTSFRFALALAVTLPTALCFGALLPSLAAAAVRHPRTLGTTGNALYALNTLGALLGTALAAFWLPAWLGVRAGYGVGVSLAVAAGLLAFHFSRPGVRSSQPAFPSSIPEGNRDVEHPDAWRHDTEPRGPGRLSPDLLGLATLSGFVSLGAQVLFVQAFALVLNQSVYAFGAVLVCVHAALAVGALAVSSLHRAWPGAGRTAMGLALTLCALALAGFPALLHGMTDGFRYVGTEESGLGYPAVSILCVAVTAG